MVRRGELFWAPFTLESSLIWVPSCVGLDWLLIAYVIAVYLSVMCAAEIESAHLMFAPFRWVPSGHISVSFHFSDDSKIVISPEAVIKKNALFSLMLGLWRAYPLQYVIESEDTVLEQYQELRRFVRTQQLNLNKAEAQRLYASMMKRAEFLRQTSELYHTLFNSCLTNIIRHLDEARAKERTRTSKFFAMLFPTRGAR